MVQTAYTLSPREAAQQLGVSIVTVKKWARAGLLKGRKNPGQDGWWRFSQQDIDDFQAAHLNQPATEATA